MTTLIFKMEDLFNLGPNNSPFIQCIKADSIISFFPLDSDDTLSFLESQQWPEDFPLPDLQTILSSSLKKETPNVGCHLPNEIQYLKQSRGGNLQIQSWGLDETTTTQLQMFSLAKKERKAKTSWG